MNSSENIEIIWNQFSSDLKSFILSRVKNEDDADDILQNTFIKIHDNLSKLRDNSKIKPWIYQITRNLIIDYFRSVNQDSHVDDLKDELVSATVSGSYMDTAINDMIKMMDEISVYGMSLKIFTFKTFISWNKY